MITKEGVKIYEEADRKHNYIMLVDVAKGRGQDYSTFNVIDISSKPFKQVAVYRNNLISPLLFPNIIYKIAKSYNEAMVVIESNDAGQVVCNGLYHMRHDVGRSSTEVISRRSAAGYRDGNRFHIATVARLSSKSELSSVESEVRCTFGE